MEIRKDGATMAAQSFEQIVSFFDEHLRNSGRRFYSEFYIGITNDVNRRLFQEHNVNRKTMWWVYSTATSKDVAERVEKYYLGKGMRGDTGGGTPESTIVYCYAVAPTTNDGVSQNA